MRSLAKPFALNAKCFGGTQNICERSQNHSQILFPPISFFSSSCPFSCSVELWGKIVRIEFISIFFPWYSRLSSHNSFVCAIASYKVWITRYKLTILSTKVQIERYKLAIARKKHLNCKIKSRNYLFTFLFCGRNKLPQYPVGRKTSEKIVWP